MGKVGRRMIKDYLSKYIEKYDIEFVICNGENVTHGKGILRHHYEELIDNGVDCVTLGNHYDSKSDIRRYINGADRIVRPLNLLHEYPGVGSIVYDLDGFTIRVSNVLGNFAMNEEVNNPYYSLIDLISDPDEEKANVHIVDFHAEATGEKICLAYALDGKVSALLGTHTHVQTKDHRILPNGTAFISDVGMTGLYEDAALGFDKDSVVNKLIYGNKSKFDLKDDGKGVFSAVVLDIDPISGKTKEIFPIYYLEA